MFLTYAGISCRGQRVTIVALAFEGSVHVDAMSVGAHACVLAFVVIWEDIYYYNILYLSFTYFIIL